jgi:hypothetical protein
MAPPTLPLLLAASLTLGGCRTEPFEPFRNIDETGEDDCPGCFDAALMLWNLQGALHEGALHPVSTSTGQRPAKLTVMLVDQYWSHLDASEQPAHACYMTYTPSLSPGSTAPSAWLDWQLALEPIEDTCGTLDPDWIDPDFHVALTGLGIEMIGEALDDGMETYLQEWFAALDAQDTDTSLDWDRDGAPYYFGVRGLLDDLSVYGSDQSHYGRAWAVDEELFILDEESGGRLLTTEQIAAGQDGWYELYARTFFSPHNELM